MAQFIPLVPRGFDQGRARGAVPIMSGPVITSLGRMGKGLENEADFHFKFCNFMWNPGIVTMDVGVSAAHCVKAGRPLANGTEAHNCI